MADNNHEQESSLSFFRLFSPIEGELREASDSGSVASLTAYEMEGYAGFVTKQLRQMDLEADSLVSAIQNAALRERVACMRPTVEAYGGRLWGVLEVQTYGELSSEKMRAVRAEWISQAKDGWGNSLERQPIPTPDGELHIQFHNDGPDYYLLMEQEVKAAHVKMQVGVIAGEYKEL